MRINLRKLADEDQRQRVSTPSSRSLAENRSARDEIRPAVAKERVTMIRKGILHETVAEIQTKLAEIGHDPGPADGWFGPLTTRAVAAFQRALQLPETGIIGPDLAKELGVTIDPAKFELPKFRTHLTLAKLDAGSAAKFKAKTSEPSSPTTPTQFEELRGLGYQPQLDRLEAIVALKLPSGYLGNPCEGGSQEHVRFYVDWAADGHWSDVGVVSFDTNDLPIADVRSHAVHIRLNPGTESCKMPRMPRVRAILSWREVPPANEPEWTPTWGNRLEARIQLAAHDDVHSLVAIDAPKPIAKFKLPKPELIKAYSANEIGLERFAATKLSKLASGKSFSLTSAKSIAMELGIDVGVLGTAIAKLPSGNTSYECIDQVGYDAYRRCLAAVVLVEQALGYSGDLCDPGSREYVRFWRWDADAARWVGLGSSSVVVHDIPRDGRLSYAVVLPVDFSELRKPCEAGPVIVRVRATLSWNDEPPAGNPDWVPTWGNTVESKFDIEQGEAVTTPTLFISAIADQPICQLGSDGYYDDAIVDNRPFGGDVLLGGLFSHASTLGPNRRLFYRVRVWNPDTGSAETLGSTFKVVVNDLTTGVLHQGVITQAATNGWYEYRARPLAPVEDDALAIWRTWGKKGLASFEVEAELRDASGTVIEAIACQRAACDTAPASAGPFLVMLDNEGPTGSLTLQAGDCHTYTKGTAIQGSFVIEDAHLNPSFGLSVDGASPTGTLTITTTASTATHIAGTWSLDTSLMRACGYVIRLTGSDKAIVGTYAEGPISANYYVGQGHHFATPSSGFCVVDP